MDEPVGVVNRLPERVHALDLRGQQVVRRAAADSRVPGDLQLREQVQREVAHLRQQRQLRVLRREAEGVGPASRPAIFADVGRRLPCGGGQAPAGLFPRGGSAAPAGCTSRSRGSASSLSVTATSDSSGGRRCHQAVAGHVRHECMPVSLRRGLVDPRVLARLLHVRFTEEGGLSDITRTSPDPPRPLTSRNGTSCHCRAAPDTAAKALENR